MQSDTAHLDEPRDPRTSVAVIDPVTDAMMDHAAHEAAALADAVAHGMAVVEQSAEQTAGAVADASERSAGAETGAGVEAAGTAVGQAAEAAEATVHSAEAVVDDVSRTVERGTEAARQSLSQSGDAFSRYNAKVLEVVSSNLASTTALFAALVQAKSLPEAMSLNADHLRRSVETLTNQGRELATLAQRIAFDALQPFKDPFDR